MTSLSVSFDPVKYGKSEVADFVRKGLVGVPSEKNSRNVKFLNVADNEIGEIDADAMGAYPQLECLDVSRNKIKSLKGLEGCGGLIVIDASQNLLRSIAPIAGLSRLKSLNVARNRVRKIDVGGVLESLTILDVSGNKLGDLSFLRFFPGLKSLNVDYCEIESLDGVAELKELKVLSCEGNMIEVVPELGVSKLNLKRNRVKSLEQLVGCGSLIEVDVSQNPLEDRDSEQHNVSLKRLVVSETRISRCQGIGRMFPKLEYFDACHSLLGDMDDLLECIRGLKSLRVLDVRFTPLTEGLYDAGGMAMSICKYNEMYPENQNARMKFRRKVLQESSHLQRLDMIDVSSEDGSDSQTETTIQSEKFSDIEAKEQDKETTVITQMDETEEEEEEDLCESIKLKKVNCTDIIVEALRDDAVLDIPRDDLVDRDVQVDIKVVHPKAKMSKDEKKLMIEKLRKQNLELQADIDRLRAKQVACKKSPVVMKLEASDDNYADDEDNAPEMFSRENLAPVVEEIVKRPQERPQSRARKNVTMIDVLESAMRENHYLQEAAARRTLVKNQTKSQRTEDRQESIPQKTIREAHVSKHRHSHAKGGEIHSTNVADLEKREPESEAQRVQIHQKSSAKNRSRKQKEDPATEHKGRTRKHERKQTENQEQAADEQVEDGINARKDRVKATTTAKKSGSHKERHHQKHVREHHKHRVDLENRETNLTVQDDPDSSCLGLDRDHIAKRLLVALRSPIQPLDVSESTDQYSFLMQWITSGLGFKPRNPALIRNPRLNFLAFERKSTHLLMAMRPCDSADSAFDKIKEPIVYAHMKLKKFMIGQSNAISICAVDLGQKTKNLTSLDPPTDSQISEFKADGYTSLTYKANGIETIVVLDPHQILPLFALSFRI